MKNVKQTLTWILNRCDDEFEAIRLGAPAIGHVLECHEISSRENGANRLFRVSTRQIGLELRTETSGY